MEEIQNIPVPEKVEVVDIQFRPGQKIYYFDPAGFDCQVGDHVIIDTARGPEYGTVVGANHQIPGSEVVPPLRCVLRKANAKDEKTLEENRATEKRAHDICLQKIAEHGLDMQLVSAECAFDGSKILFFFTADERVDFRELVKNLASIFHTRIELRQIGVRDKAKMVGGLGICGRPFCCASFLDDFQPVSIKMAKTQNLSLNPTKISGTCGRLMCCLKYEQDAYEDLLRRTPKEESFVDTPDGRGTVIEVSLLRQKVKVRLEEDPDTIAQFHVDDIAVWRNGKAKKNDEPIPADWAPISAGGKRKRRLENPEPVQALDAIRFRYTNESVAEEATIEEVAEQEEGKSASRRSRRNRGGNRPKIQPEEAAPVKQEKVEKPAKQDRAEKAAKLEEHKPKQEKPKHEQAKPKQEKPKHEQAKHDAPKHDAPKAKAEHATEKPAAEGGEKKPHRNHHRRHHRKPKPAGKAE